MKKLLIIIALLLVLMPVDAKRNKKHHSKNSGAKVETVTTDPVAAEADTVVAEADTVVAIAADGSIIDENPDTVMESEEVEAEMTPYDEDWHDRDGRLKEMFDNLSNDDASAAAIAILIILAVVIGVPLFLVFILPLLVLFLIVWLVVRHDRKKQREKNDLIKSLAASGQDVTPLINNKAAVNSQRSKVNAPRPVANNANYSKAEYTGKKGKMAPTMKQKYDKGVTNSIIGGVIAVVCWWYNWPSLFVLGGLILCGIGISQLISAKKSVEYEDDAKVEPSTPTEEPAQEVAAPTEESSEVVAEPTVETPAEDNTETETPTTEPTEAE